MAKSTTAPRGPQFHKPQYEVPDFGKFFGDDADGLSCLCNDDLETPEGRLRYQVALDRGSVITDAVMDSGFVAKWFYIFRVESVNDDGEITGAHYRIVFLGNCGESYETHSDSALRTLRSWIASRGWEPWEPPVEFYVEKKVGRSQRVYHKLRLGLSRASGTAPAE